MNKAELEICLRTHKISLENWGKGESKTLDHLQAELESGESKLLETDDYKLVREEVGVGINVYYIRGNRRLKLKEDRQVFRDGRIRTRKLNTSIGEKIKPDESPEEAALRAFKEELEIPSINLSNHRVEDQQPVESKSFPGLLTKRLVHIYDAQISDENFKPEGYREIQDDKTTYFEWKKVKKAN